MSETCCEKPDLVKTSVAGAEEFEPSLVSDTLQHPEHFIGHVTGWYFCQTLDTQQYSRFKDIMQRHDLQREPLGEVRVKQIELRQFTSMEAWGNKPLAQLTLAANSSFTRLRSR